MRSRRSTPDRKRCVDLEAALAGILDCFRIGRIALFLSSLFRPRIDRILFAATKADHLHHSSHDRLEAVLRRTVGQGGGTRRGHRRRDRRGRAGRGARHPRGDGRARPRQIALDPGDARSRRDGRWRSLRRQDRGRDLSRRSARRCRRALCGRRRISRPRQRCRPKRPIFAFCAFGRRNWRARTRMARPCLTSASTAPSSS